MSGPNVEFRRHECERIPKGGGTQVRKDLSDGIWELVDTTDSFYHIKYCPYCGKELNVD